MARKYEFSFGGNKTGYGWGMEQCEERLLWAAYSEVSGRVPADQIPRRIDFYAKFFEDGVGVAFQTVDWINSIRKRAGLSEISFEETNIGDYGRMTDRTEKARLRRDMRTDYFGLDLPGRTRWKRQAEQDIAHLLPPHFTFAEVKDRRAQFIPNTLTQGERMTRLRVVDQIKQQPAEEPEIEEMQPVQETAAVARAVRQLRLARKPETISRIIEALSPDDALELAESGKLEDPDMIEALIERSLGEA